RLATCDLRLATCDLRLATCDLRLATCNLRLATCDFQRVSSRRSMRCTSSRCMSWRSRASSAAVP
ncbi:MAG TPA: hypothetical protein ENN42_04595, partial [Thioalkalivibrio sp.]|nr:hypothetical protein [Thioalkalivibrio sp.]